LILKQFVVPDTLDGEKLSAVVSKMLPLVASECLRDAFKRRDVKLNGIRAAKDEPVCKGMNVAVYLSDSCEGKSPRIIYEDERLIVIDKPSGISCDADEKGGLTIGEALQSAYPDRFSAPPMPCHRLDNQTAGLLILARDEVTRRLMEQAFRERMVHKRYVCMVRGEPKPAHAVLNAYLHKDAHNAKVTVLDVPRQDAVAIRTEYTVLAGGEASRLLVTLHTGRTHQIRAHLAHIGHPLLGDDKYGDRLFNRLHHARRLMLCATELTFSMTGELAYLNGKRFSVDPDF
jgi:23S rRNA pseudouridine955/2504/2580 synthase